VATGPSAELAKSDAVRKAYFGDLEVAEQMAHTQAGTRAEAHR
jgi:hypothetical protein